MSAGNGSQLPPSPPYCPPVTDSRCDPGSTTALMSLPHSPPLPLSISSVPMIEEHGPAPVTLILTAPAVPMRVCAPCSPTRQFAYLPDRGHRPRNSPRAPSRRHPFSGQPPEHRAGTELAWQEETAPITGRSALGFADGSYVPNREPDLSNDRRWACCEPLLQPCCALRSAQGSVAHTTSGRPWSGNAVCPGMPVRGSGKRGSDLRCPEGRQLLAGPSV